jgi:hypothetical protein
MARNKLSESISEAAQFLGGFCPILPVAHIIHKQKSQQLLIDYGSNWTLQIRKKKMNDQFFSAS